MALELRFVRQKEGHTLMGSDGQPMVLTKKVLQYREVYPQKYPDVISVTDWKTVPFDESVVLDAEDKE